MTTTKIKTLSFSISNRFHFMISGLLNYSALNREMISDFIGHSILLVVPLLKLAQRHAKHIVARWKRDRSKRLTGIAAQNIKCEEASAVSASLLCAECSSYLFSLFFYILYLNVLKGVNAMK